MVGRQSKNYSYRVNGVRVTMRMGVPVKEKSGYQSPRDLADSGFKSRKDRLSVYPSAKGVSARYRSAFRESARTRRHELMHAFQIRMHSDARLPLRSDSTLARVEEDLIFPLFDKFDARAELLGSKNISAHSRVIQGRELFLSSKEDRADFFSQFLKRLSQKRPWEEPSHILSDFGGQIHYLFRSKKEFNDALVRLLHDPLMRKILTRLNRPPSKSLNKVTLSDVHAFFDFFQGYLNQKDSAV